MMQSLKDLNFRNLLEWYGGEIDRILHGERATEVFTTAERRILRRAGILQRTHSQGKGYGRRTILSKRVEDLMKAREKEVKA